jgi:hypothetical protein
MARRRTSTRPPLHQCPARVGPPSRPARRPWRDQLSLPFPPQIDRPAAPALLGPERHLLIAVVHRAVLDARSAVPAVRQEACAWLMSPEAHAFCEVLELPWPRLRAWVEAHCPAPVQWRRTAGR